MQLNIFDTALTPAPEADVLSLPPCPICSGKLRVNSVILSCENPDHYGILCRGELVRDESGNYKEPVPFIGFYDKTNKIPGRIAPPETGRIQATAQGPIERYRLWLWEKLKRRDQAVIEELITIVGFNQVHGDCRLACWCAPRPCHVDVIIKALQTEAVTFILSEEIYKRGIKL